MNKLCIPTLFSGFYTCELNSSCRNKREKNALPQLENKSCGAVSIKDVLEMKILCLQGFTRKVFLENAKRVPDTLGFRPLTKARCVLYVDLHSRGKNERVEWEVAGRNPAPLFFFGWEKVKSPKYFVREHSHLVSNKAVSLLRQ